MLSRKSFFILIASVFFLSGCAHRAPSKPSPPAEADVQPHAEVKQESNTVTSTDHLFSLDTVKVGDVIAGMTLRSLAPFSQVMMTPTLDLPLSSYNAHVEFSGTATVTGEHYWNELFQKVCFDVLDPLSGTRLPRIDGDTRKTWFCFANQDEAQAVLGKEAPGTATIVIDDYAINVYESEVANTATLVRRVDTK